MNISKKKNDIVAVFAAHPDDEILGAGATFTKLVDKGKEVHAIIVCEGESIRYDGNIEVDLMKHARNAASIIGFSSIKFLKLPEQKLDSISLVDINQELESIIDSLNPQVVYTHYHGDINRDHQIVNESVLVATRPFNKIIKEIYAFETPSSTGLWKKHNFNPDTYEVVNDYLDKKIEALSCYESEILDFPHPRSLKSIEARAKYWGSLINQKYVEPFITLRNINM